MSRIVYVNGEYLPIERASVPVMDRGFLFGDGIYEVSAVLDGKLVDNEGHLLRLQRSLKEIGFNSNAVDISLVKIAQQELILKNNIQNGLIYIQVTRGTAERDFNYADDLQPNILMFTQSKDVMLNKGKTVTAITVEDIRWKRRDIKSTSLLAQVLAKNEARRANAFEAIMFDGDGFVTEGSSSNIFIVKDNEIITRGLSNDILHGITRAAIISLANNEGIRITERPFTVEEIYSADECFMTSATTFCLGIVNVDGKAIADGKQGAVTAKLFDHYLAAAKARN